MVEHQEKCKKNDYIDSEHVLQTEQELKAAEEEARKAQANIDKLKKRSESSEAGAVLTRVISRIEKERKKEKKPIKNVDIPTIENVSTPFVSAKKRRTDKLSRCNKQERKLIGKIFNIIIKSTDEATAEYIIKNIEEEFK